jgi:hypothetical protein
MGFQDCIALTVLVSCILLIWPNHPSLCALAKFVMFLLCILLFYLIPGWFLLDRSHFHKLGQIFYSKFYFQKPVVCRLLFLVVSMLHKHSDYIGLTTEKYNFSVAILDMSLL